MWIFWAGHWKIEATAVYNIVKCEKRFVLPQKTGITFLLTASYRTSDVGFVKATVDASCPTDDGDNNWRDYYNVPFDPLAIVRTCPENEGDQVASSRVNKLS